MARLPFGTKRLTIQEIKAISNLTNDLDEAQYLADRASDIAKMKQPSDIKVAKQKLDLAWKSLQKSLVLETKVKAIALRLEKRLLKATGRSKLDNQERWAVNVSRNIGRAIRKQIELVDEARNQRYPSSTFIEKISDHIGNIKHHVFGLRAIEVRVLQLEK